MQGYLPVLQRTSWLAWVVHRHYHRVVFFNSPYIQFAIYRAHAKIPRSIPSISFRDIMDMAQKFEGVVYEKTVWQNGNQIVNITFSGLIELKIHSVARWCSLFGTQWRPELRCSCLGDIVTSKRTMILNRLIPMLCSCISSRGVCSTTKAYLLALEM